jgi:hypothetical protein
MRSRPVRRVTEPRVQILAQDQAHNCELSFWEDRKPKSVAQHGVLPPIMVMAHLWGG